MFKKISEFEVKIKEYVPFGITWEFLFVDWIYRIKLDSSLCLELQTVSF
jgi:hypothetical protein